MVTRIHQSSDEGGRLLKLANGLWMLLVALLVLFAVYVSTGRLLAGMVGSYQAPLLRELSRQLPVELDAAGVSARWRGFRPQLLLRELSLRESGEASPAVTLREGRATLDVWGSLTSGSLRVGRLLLAGLDLQAELTAEGDFRLLGLGGGQSGSWVEALLLDLERVILVDNRLLLRLPDGSVQHLEVDLTLLRDGSRRQLRADLRTARGAAITLLADGLGNPFDSTQYSGDVYARMEIPDLAALANWHPDLNDLPVSLQGAADVELWLDWRAGQPNLDARVEARDLRWSGREAGSWSLPPTRLSGSVSARPADEGWQVSLRDVQLGEDPADLKISRVMVQTRGDGLQLSARAVPLQMLRLLGGESGPLGGRLGEALEVLEPGGELPQLQLQIDDLNQPGRGWALSASFEALALESWQGAPGVRGGAGSLRLQPGYGRVLLDSTDIALTFPTVYRHPLAWHHLQASLDLHWNADRLRLQSGPISAEGEEGRARALFGLDIPLRPEQGDIDMQLLVGVQDSDPRHRDKYLPYILPDGLLDWLSDSLDGGHLREGAFVWRGSLRPGAVNERTVQLFFTVEDGRLRFDPRWPALSGLSGTVLIDDARVSIWSERARLFNTEVTRLSGETWRDASGELRLVVDAGLSGSAADGLRVLHQSPLAEPLGGALAEWTAEGALAARLRLDIPLSVAAPPEVALQLELADVTLGIRPGQLTLEAIQGQLEYASGAGFASRGLAARLWGESLSLELQQERGAPSQLAPGPVHVSARGELSTAALAQWLGVSEIRLPATGRAGVEGRLSFHEGDVPQLLLQSDLRGVAIDLPAPLGKPADTALPLTLATALGRESLRLDARLGRLLQAQLALRDGKPEAVSLAFHDRPLPLQPGVLRLTGQLPALRVEDWQSFLSGFSAGDDNVGLSPRIESLQLGSLQVFGQDWPQAIVSLRRRPADWWLELEAPALKGSLAWPVADGPAVLNLDALDFALLGGRPGDGESLDPGQWSELPDLRVNIRQLYRGGRSFGNLAFRLAFARDGVRATRLQGDLPGLALATGQPASLHWSADGTRLQAGLRVDDLGETFAAMDYQRILETQGGALGVDFQWPGSPASFRLAGADGVLHIDLRQGRFLNAPAGASGTLRVVSVLNLADLIQRLSLNQVFESGIAFDRLRGEVLLRNGYIRVPELEVASAGSALVFSGESEIARRSLNGELVATLPVASNLPWVAALAGGLPMAAGVYVVSKVFERQVSQLSSAVYRLEGSWDEPQLRLDRIFDIGERGAQSAPESSPQ